MTAPAYSITKWRHSRYWAVMRGDTLIVLCVCRKGARELVRHLEARRP
jgi:hypothetical protein